MKKTIANVQQVAIPRISDPRGNLAVVENETFPFDIKRVYYLYDVPSDSQRGGHSHIEQHEMLVAVSGSFEVVIDDGYEKKKILLNKPNIGLLIPTGIWRELDNFSSGSVCLVFNSGVFDEKDYLRNYQEFLVHKKRE